MSTTSDNTKPSIRIADLLPSVYQSDVNTSMFGNVFDRHLSKDDTSRVAGFIGPKNPHADINRQIAEPSAHRQAYQLAPTVVTEQGQETLAMSFSNFRQQLELMGVDMERAGEWGATTQYNWVPPINMDMLINYRDYFWQSTEASSPQYLTVESPCNKSKSRVQAYQTTIDQYGSSISIDQIDYVSNSYLVRGNQTSLFVDGFQFYTTSAQLSFASKFWHVAGSTYQSATDATVVEVVEPIAHVGESSPVSPSPNQLWYQTSTNSLLTYINGYWTSTQQVTVLVDLLRKLQDYQLEQACACHGTVGWDAGQWDSGDGSNWDSSNSCFIPERNYWADANRWVHKTEVSSFVDVRRAQVPIIEYDSRVELSKWVKRSFAWKYRPSMSGAFVPTSKSPTRVELDPVRGYQVANIADTWVLYLYGAAVGQPRDINLTQLYPAGSQIRVVDYTGATTIYNVRASTYRNVISSDPTSVQAAAGLVAMVTVVELDDNVFSSPLQGGGIIDARIEPVTTSSGDPWLGYHIHWCLDMNATTQSVSASVPSSAAAEYDRQVPLSRLEISTLPVHADDGISFTPSAGAIEVGRSLQRYTVVGTSLARLDLLDVFRRGGTHSSYVLPGSGDLRVVVNGRVLAAAEYTEIVGQSVATTMVGQTTLTGYSHQYVKAIGFASPLTNNDVVTVHVGPASALDEGLEHVFVRTVEDESAFAIAVSNKVQPIPLSITRVSEQPQLKSVANQYPLFNTFDLVSGEIVGASELFKFKHDANSPINGALGMRIVASSDSKEYEFEQTLIDSSSRTLGYRMPTLMGSFWYNPLTKSIVCKRGNAWHQTVAVVVGLTLIETTPVVSISVPRDALIWFNPTSGEVKRKLGTGWFAAGTVDVSESDPALRSVWQTSSPHMNYAPSKVDEDKNPSLIGDWGVFQQWAFNSEHRNSQSVKYTQLLTHFRTILDSQIPLPGLAGGGNFARDQSQFNVGVGGTIKEHNDGFDTLISAINLTNVSPVGVITFAAREYASSLQMIDTTFRRSFVDTVAAYTISEPTGSLESYLASHVIAAYETNDALKQQRGDSTSYVGGYGIRNWIATAPMLGLSPLTEPTMHVGTDGVRLVHHDGHRSTVDLSTAETDRLSRLLCRIPDTRTSTELGVISSNAPPTTHTDLRTMGQEPRTNVMWYQTSSRTLYRLNASHVGLQPPVVPRVGQLYFNTGTNTTYEWSGTAWVSVPFSQMWSRVLIPVLLGQTIYAVELKLYQVVKFNPPTRQFTPTGAGTTTYANYMRERFLAYASASGDDTPLINSGFIPQRPFTWNYRNANVIAPPIVTASHVNAACWQELYTGWWNTPYPHIEPWKVQGYVDAPTWWESMYGGSGRRWGSTMWTNIIQGIVPAGYLYPNGTISTGNPIADQHQVPAYAYVPVNIQDVIIGGYEPDALLPPYFVPTSGIRSLITDLSHVPNMGADYAFGDGSPSEWRWKTSYQYNYDKLVVGFLMSPSHFMFDTFGHDYVRVNGIPFSRETGRVPSHRDIVFHGDVVNNVPVSVHGINQWYVMYNRVSGVDTNGDFRGLWAAWRPKLTYQFAGIVDTETVELTNRYFDLIPQDYAIKLVNSGIVDRIDVNSFDVSLLSIPPAIVQYNNESQWKMNVDSIGSTNKTISVFGVKSYVCVPSVSSSSYSAFKYVIVSVDPATSSFYVGGDVTDQVHATRTLSGPDNVHLTVTGSTFEPSINETRISVSVLPAMSAGAQLQLNRSLPWSTGDRVSVSSTKHLPQGLYEDYEYFFIRLSDTEFALADTYTDAVGHISVPITNVGSGVITVSQVESSFRVFGGEGNSGEVWKHFAMDMNQVRVITLPHIVQGMQHFINMFDGYSAVQHRLNVLQHQSIEGNIDAVTGRNVSWQVEVERFVDWAYGLRTVRMATADTYAASVVPNSDQVEYTGMRPSWKANTPVVIEAPVGYLLPTPLLSNVTYYATSSGPNTFKLYTVANSPDSAVVFGSIANTAVVVKPSSRSATYPRFELNAHRNHIWIDTPHGVLSNVITGPYPDIHTRQLVMDQYGRPVGEDKVSVYRNDKLTKVSFSPEIQNDVDLAWVDDPYNYIHFGSVRLFVEGFEHYLIFNDYTVGGDLVYDQFLGLNASRFNLDYYEKTDYTLRPTMGGYFLLNGQFKRNMEGSIGDMREFYNVTSTSEGSPVTSRARGLVGYTGRMQFLDYLNVNRTSQFQFYRGMIQSKGSVASVKAYINSRRFVDASVDEFWAYRLGTFGSSAVKVYPEVNLFAVDGLTDDIRLMFMARSETITDDDVVQAAQDGFTIISPSDQSRWFQFPEQLSDVDSPLFLDADMALADEIYAGITPPHPSLGTAQWYNTTTGTLNKLVNGQWVVDFTPPRGSTHVYLRVSRHGDDVRVVRKQYPVLTTSVASFNGSSVSLFGDRRGDITAQMFVAFSNGVAISVNQVNSVSFNGTHTVVTLNGALTFTPSTLSVSTASTYEIEALQQGEGDDQFTVVGTDTIRFNAAGFSGLFTLYSVQPAFARLNPCKLIDNKAHAIVATVPLWDPAFNMHAQHPSIWTDLSSSADPANYRHTVNPANASDQFWGSERKGFTWWDQNALWYKAYHNSRIYPNVNQRLYKWGVLADWASVEVKQWVESDVAPDVWNALHDQQSATTPLNVPVSGRAHTRVFKRIRESVEATVSTTTGYFTTVAPLDITSGSQVLVGGDTLPQGIDALVKYQVEQVAGSVYRLIDGSTGSTIVPSSAGSNVSLLPAFSSTDWVEQPLVHVRTTAPEVVAHSQQGVFGVWPALVSTSTIPLMFSRDARWMVGDVVDVHINDVFVASGEIADGNSTALKVVTAQPIPISEYDILDIVRPVKQPSQDELSVNPDVEDDGSVLVQWTVGYNYSTDVTSDGSQRFYFWVNDSKQATNGRELTPYQIAAELKSPSVPHVVIQSPKDDPYLAERYGYGMIKYGAAPYSMGNLTDAEYRIPVTYRQAVVRQVANLISDDDRYTLKFTRDWTLRATERGNNERHNEWALIRRSQSGSIPRELWNKAAEALAGRSALDSTVRVPALERELFDAKYGTNTRFGLRTGQAFVDKTIGLATLKSYLQSPTNDFAPVDIDGFFETHDFTTSEGILAAMADIYENFSSLHVNNIWFELLLDALSTRTKYPDIMKTSWVALHGIRVLEVGGLFDE